MQQDSTTLRRPTGRPFRKGHDPRRKVFTPAEQRENFYSALASVTAKHGENAARNFMRWICGQRGMAYTPIAISQRGKVAA